jgi:serine/threonine/tyrosine-interacting protein
MDNRCEAKMITASQVLGAIPSGEYSWRVSLANTSGVQDFRLMQLKAPSPPHIHIPPVPEKISLVLPAHNGSLIDADTEDAQSREILRIITGGPQTVQVKDWAYESRRQFQAILSFLYLGPFTAAKNIHCLKKEGITMLLVVRDTRSAMSGLLSGQKVADQLGIDHAAIDVDGNSQLIQYGFPKAVSLINEHLVSKYKQHSSHLTIQNSPDEASTAMGRVLVFCESGNERSAAVVVAYLMAMFDIDLVGAIQYLQTQRFCIAFDDSLKNLLYNYQQLLEARKTVLETQKDRSISSPLTAAVVKKRIRDEIDKDDISMSMSMDEMDDAERFLNRKAFAPFYS